MCVRGKGCIVGVCVSKERVGLHGVGMNRGG
jgi:hypothetical protein